MSTLECAQPGDKLIVTSDHIVATRSIETVERVTAKQVITGKSRYWKQSGYIVGSKTERSGFGGEPRAHLATKEEIKSIKADRARWDMSRREFWNDLPDDAVLEIWRRVMSRKESKKC